MRGARKVRLRTKAKGRKGLENAAAPDVKSQLTSDASKEREER